MSVTRRSATMQLPPGSMAVGLVSDFSTLSCQYNGLSQHRICNASPAIGWKKGSTYPSVTTKRNNPPHTPGEGRGTRGPHTRERAAAAEKESGKGARRGDNKKETEAGTLLGEGFASPLKSVAWATNLMRMSKLRDRGPFPTGPELVRGRNGRTSLKIETIAMSS